MPYLTKYLSLILFICIVLVFIRQMYEYINQKRHYTKSIEFINTENRFKNFIIIFAIAVISRYVLYFIIYLLVYNPLVNTSFADALSGMLLRSDAPHYIDIAKDFYVTSGDARYFIVFLPLYPVIVSALNYFIGNYILSAYLISDVCLGIACYFLYEVARPYIGSKGAKHSVYLLLLFPVSFFLGGAFTESMFIMLCAIFFYLIDRDRYFPAAIIGFFAALTRNVGFLLVVPYLVKLYFDLKPGKVRGYKTYFKYASFSLLIVLGMGVYILINKLVTGNAFQFLVYAKEHWSQGLGFFSDSISILTYRAIIDAPEVSYTLFIPELISIFFALFVLLFGGKHLKPHYFAYAICYFAITMGATWLLSAPRYLMALLPIYIILGKVAAENKKACIAIYIFFSAALLYMTAAFSLGYYIY